MRLRTRFALVISGIVVEVVAGCSLFLLWSERGFLAKQVESQQVSMLKSLSRVARESHLSKDDLVLLNYIRSLPEEHPALESAWVVRSSDRLVVAHTDLAKLGLKEADLQTPPEPVLSLEGPVRVGEHAPFTAHVSFSRRATDRLVDEQLVATQLRIVWVSALMLFVGVLTAFWLANTLARPIGELMGAAAEIGRGHLKTRLDARRKDELGQLASRFNDMAGELEKLDELKRDFVFSVTHELKSPLSAIESYLDLILFENRKRQASVERWVEYTSYIKSNTSRLARFIADLLDAAKIERGQFEVRKAPTRVDDVAREVVALFEPRAKEGKVALECEAGTALPEVSADAERLRQVFENLVSNALKFTPEGGRVRVLVAPHDGEVRVTVSDTGVGIPDAAMAKLFGKFEQVPGSRQVARGPKGTGLGLFIAKTIVDAHGGRIWAESVPGSGAKFHFTLKASEVKS